MWTKMSHCTLLAKEIWPASAPVDICRCGAVRFQQLYNGKVGAWIDARVARDAFGVFDWYRKGLSEIGPHTSDSND